MNKIFKIKLPSILPLWMIIDCLYISNLASRILVFFCLGFNQSLADARSQFTNKKLSNREASGVSTAWRLYRLLYEVKPLKQPPLTVFSGDFKFSLKIKNNINVYKILK